MHIQKNVLLLHQICSARTFCSVKKNDKELANMVNHEETEIVSRACENIQKMFELRARFSQKGVKGDQLLDGILQLGNIQFACVLKLRVTSYNINAIYSSCQELRRQHELPVLLLAGEIPTFLMQQLYQDGIDVLDAAGNCYIRQEGLMMFCQGRKNEFAAGKEILSFKEPGLKVLYFILSDINNVNLPFREIQAQTGVGLATINKLFTSLKQNGYLFSSSKGRHLKKLDGLLAVFVDNYCRVIKPKALMATMTFLPNGREQWMEKALPQGMQWGGEPGAYMRDRYLHPEVWDVYSSVPSAKLISDRVAIPARDGEIHIYRKFWMDDPEEKTAPALIIYADLMGSGDSRCIEAAQRIFEDELSYLR